MVQCRVAGTASHDASLASAATSDADMNFAPGVIDLSELKQFEGASWLRSLAVDDAADY